MATTKENDNFRDEIFSRYALDDAIDWINSNLEPEEVFNEKQLENWAIENGYIREVV